VLTFLAFCRNKNIRLFRVLSDYYQKAADFAKIMPGFDPESVEYYLSEAKKMREEKK